SETNSFFFSQAHDVIRYRNVTGVQTCALPISGPSARPDRETATTRPSVPTQPGSGPEPSAVSSTGEEREKTRSSTAETVSDPPRSEERRAGTESSVPRSQEPATKEMTEARTSL